MPFLDKKMNVNAKDFLLFNFNNCKSSYLICILIFMHEVNPIKGNRSRKNHIKACNLRRL